MFYLDFIVILFALEKLHVFKIAFLGQENVRLVLNILFRRWKFVLAFLVFYLFADNPQVQGIATVFDK